MMKILAVMGTRPEKVKIEPVLRGLGNAVRVEVLETGQHSSLISRTDVQSDAHEVHYLALFEEKLELSEAIGWLGLEISRHINANPYDLVLVQGDTISALAGAMAARFSGVAVGHIEAGLRTFNENKPWPEELARKAISSIANLHFAPTETSKRNLVAEGVPTNQIWVTGNTSVDVVEDLLGNEPELRGLLASGKVSPELGEIVVTLHRREAHGTIRKQALENLKSFLDSHPGFSALILSHPNPSVLEDLAGAAVGNHPSVSISEPLSHREMMFAIASAPFVISDSGGLQEEAPSLGRSVFVARDETERPEAVESGLNFICGADLSGLENSFSVWSNGLGSRLFENPYGDGDAGQRIATILMEWLGESSS